MKRRTLPMSLHPKHFTQLGLYTTVKARERPRGSKSEVSEVRPAMRMIGTSIHPFGTGGARRFHLGVPPGGISRRCPNRRDREQEQHGHEQPAKKTIAHPGRKLKSNEQACHVAGSGSSVSADSARI
jgi:hypothetical protein